MTETFDPNEAPAATPHPETATVTLADVRHVAALANLQLTAEEEPRMQRDLNAILGHVAELQKLNTDGVEPMAQVGQLLQKAPALGGSSLRPDAVKPSLDRTAVMEEAPDTDGRFFKVPKVIER
ncbi:Asp-tRNA(Asn)/Glu-tRNA(Gln) amidotransferase subunit GatC [Terriglobus roseus]|uniref:Aspartyl/glutamyl-tRNA(Asn/Gln) amidotransferase subunit C n=1 Tax=Terriglobus roseus TaxID=392734 RepID=A0A1G7G837_9BACT|nr:Asp-tRNA(Asn)/Glu-tRNA(Gln) amidotransferase subunit GatC [Terriglobus roseus]SDE84281.1 aspartyl/glutamyl-tRNA(Asn/Gln) amidotransferase subunit C [Terriglobus roseus]